MNYNPRPPVTGRLASILALSDVAEPDHIDSLGDRPTLHRSYTSHHEFLEDEDDNEEEEWPLDTPKSSADHSHHVAEVKREDENISPPENVDAKISMKADMRTNVGFFVVLAISKVVDIWIEHILE